MKMRAAAAESQVNLTAGHVQSACLLIKKEEGQVHGTCTGDGNSEIIKNKIKYLFILKLSIIN